MNILFTLCGRAGSKGVKGKNARDFLDIPLACYSTAGISLYIEKYGSSENTCDVVVNTDSQDLMNIMDSAKGVAVTKLWRDSSLAGDKVSKVDVIKDCLLRAEKEFGKAYDMVVDLDITSPLRTVEDIKNAIDRKIARNDVRAVFSVANSRRNPYFNMVTKKGEFFDLAFPSHYTTRQEAPVFYDMNASIYAYSSTALKEIEPAILLDEKCDAIVMDDTGVLDIDSEEDYELMQVIAKFLFENKEKYHEVYQLAQSWR